MKLINLLHKRFGKLKVILKLKSHPKWRRGQWLCKCDCGEKTIVTSNRLTLGITKSCGCLKNKTTQKGDSFHPYYSIYIGIRNRCLNPKDKHFKYYGGRGIKLCKRWQGRKGFRTFVHDIGNRPSKNHSVDRKNGNKDYKPSNCRWATKKQQANNRRIPKTIEMFSDKEILLEIERRKLNVQGE